MADNHNTAHAQWKFNALYADTEVRSVADDKLLAVVRAGPEKARILGLLKAAETPGTALLRGEGEQFTRFCPGCGSVGDVESKFRDCCPDGAGARLIPASLAQKCHGLFRLALVGASQPELSESQPNSALADGWLNPDDLAALERFNECAEDSEADGHDVPKERMKRLAELGAVQSRGFGRHETTAFGRLVLGSQFARRPLETTDECNARLGREHRAKLEMPAPPSLNASNEGSHGK